MIEFLQARTHFIAHDENCKLVESVTFVDVLPRSLTVDLSYRAKRFQKDNKTIFREAKVFPLRFTLTPAMREVFAAVPGNGPKTKAELFGAIKAELLRVIEETWIPGGAHAFLHSSGYDSRVLSFLLRELYRKNGPGWLGTVVFLCTKWEASSFRDIMGYLGWDGHWLVPRWGQKGQGEYYAQELLDFRNAWRKLNGVAAIPVNLFWWLVEDAQKLGLLPEEGVQTWTGYWGNTVLDAGSGPDAGRGIQDVLVWFNRSHLNMRPLKGDEEVMPYTSARLALAVATSPVRLGYDLRPQFIRWLDPKLASFRNVNAEGDRMRPIARWIMDEVKRSYDNSWYGQEVAPGVKFPGSTEFNPAWGHWSAASLCEHLLSEGYIIEVK